MELKDELRRGNLILVNDKIEKMHNITEEFPFVESIYYGHATIDWKEIKPIPISTATLHELLFFTELGFHARVAISDNIELYYCGHEKVMRLQSRCAGFTLPLKCEYIHDVQNFHFGYMKVELLTKAITNNYG